MSRPPRVDFPGAIHHVTTRGARGMEIFHHPGDRTRFLDLMKRYANHYAMAVLAYCLMPNHVHLLVLSRGGNLSDFMAVLKARYSKWFNKQRDSQGTLYQKRFRSELVQDGRYFNMAFRYVVTNPHRAGLADPTRLVHPWNSLSELDRQKSFIAWEEVFSRLQDVTPDSLVDFLRADRETTWTEARRHQRSDRNLRIIGDDEFLERMLAKLDQPTREQRPEPGPVEPKEILRSVCVRFGIEEPEQLLSSPQSRQYRAARFCAYFLLHRRSRLSFEEIGDRMNVSGAAVSYGIERLREESPTRQQGSLLKQWNVDPGSI